MTAEINGTEQAINTLANDTRLLAAIERQIAGQQQKSQQAKGSAMTILDALDKLSKNEITRKDFNESIIDPIKYCAEKLLLRNH